MLNSSTQVPLGIVSLCVLMTGVMASADENFGFGGFYFFPGIWW
jgi:hypothetical protein